MTEPLTCAETREVIPDLAVGSLSGDDRARVLDHLAGCPDCEAMAAELSGVADSLLQLTPDVDPPAGFESAVLARITGSDRPVRLPLWRRRTVALGVAAAALVLAGTAGGVALTDRGGTPRFDQSYIAALKGLGGRDLRGATLLNARRQAWGQAFVYEGSTSWVFVSMHWDVPDGSYQVVLDRSDGPSSTLVTPLTMTDGEGSTGVAVGGTRTISAVRVVNAAGRTVCTAHLPPDTT